MSLTDPAAVAASTAMGWSYALNTVARPAAEHLEAAQAALSALERADQAGTWADTRGALSEALSAARGRLAPHSPTVAELVAAVAELRAIGVLPEPAPTPGVPEFVVNGAIAAGDARNAELATRIAELEDLLALAEDERDDIQGQLNDAESEKAKLRQLRDRFESEARDLREAAKRTSAGQRAAENTAARKAERGLWLRVLALHGMNPPGFVDMEIADLERIATETVSNVIKAEQLARKREQETGRRYAQLRAGLERLVQEQIDERGDGDYAAHQLSDQALTSELDHALRIYGERLDAEAQRVVRAEAELAAQLLERKQEQEASKRAHRAEAELVDARDRIRALEAEAAELRTRVPTRVGFPLTPPENGPLVTGD